VTFGIPTLDRPDHLQFAIDSCLKQTVPVHIVVADQGHSRETEAVVRRYSDHPNVEHVLTRATCLQENWEAAYRACDTEFFAILQDDDTIGRAYASRIVKAFDAFPQALHLQASVYVTPDRIHSIRWGWCGPQVGVNMQDLVPEQWHGEYLIGSMYVTSWALSPGVAFRVGREANEAWEAMPMDCDLFAERLILAEMGSRGDWIAEPITAGFWHHHGHNESYNQNANGSIDQQYRSMVDHLDGICDRTEAWEHGLTAWCGMRGAAEVLGWLKAASENPKHPISLSRHSREIQAAMCRSLEGRIMGGFAPQSAEEPVLIFD
jgi:glycosyltransferase involved in cell wall biosynthesis